MADVSLNETNTNHEQLYKQGLRAFIIQDFETAVKAFSRVSELLVKELQDDLHDKLGDVYLYYGKSLLEFARKDLENTCLNKNMIKNADEESSDEAETEGAGDGEEEPEPEEEGEGEEAEATDGDKKEGDESAETKDNKTEEESAATAQGGDGDNKTEEKKDGGEASTSTGEGSSKPAEEEEEKEDELTDLQVAWEILELARKIFSNRGEKGRKELADTLISLGEVSLEGGNFETAIEDILQGLNIQKTIFANDSRAVAETYYKLGGAYYCNKQIDESIESFQMSYDYLKCRLNNLKKNTGATEDEQDEIKELEDLIPEVEEKIVDMKSYKVEQSVLSKTIEEEKKETGPSVASSSSSSSSRQANDISHLVKRKRPSENGVEEPQAKKPSP